MNTPDLTSAVWRKASRSESVNGCVEVAQLADGLVAVRDSKDTTRPAHIYPGAAWDAFLDQLRGGPAQDRVEAIVTDDGVTLHDRALSPSGAPHTYTHHEWACFLDGVHAREPQLAAA
jgi:hypothetical protein